jgi:hypothetical protein
LVVLGGVGGGGLVGWWLSGSYLVVSYLAWCWCVGCESYLPGSRAFVACAKSRPYL